MDSKFKADGTTNLGRELVRGSRAAGEMCFDVGRGHWMLRCLARLPESIAMAGRAGVKLPLERFEALSHITPRLLDLRPAGRFLMEDFYFAGGLPALLAQLLGAARVAESRRDALPRVPDFIGGRWDARERVPPLLYGDAATVNGRTISANVADAKIWNTEVIRPRAQPLAAEGGAAVLRGNPGSARRAATARSS